MQRGRYSCYARDVKRRMGGNIITSINGVGPDSPAKMLDVRQS
jgi:hypothetical protein